MYWGYIGKMEKNMETPGVYRDYIGYMLALYNIGIMETSI